jgi:hypothetical protein
MMTSGSEGQVTLYYSENGDDLENGKSLDLSNILMQV